MKPRIVQNILFPYYMCHRKQYLSCLMIFLPKEYPQYLPLISIEKDHKSLFGNRVSKMDFIEKLIWNTVIVFLLISENFCYHASDCSNKDYIHQQDGSFWKEFLKEKNGFQKAAIQRKSSTIFKAISSPFILIQNLIFSLMMTNTTHFTYYSLKCSLVLAYVSAAELKFMCQLHFLLLKMLRILEGP